MDFRPYGQNFSSGFSHEQEVPMYREDALAKEFQEFLGRLSVATGNVAEEISDWEGSFCIVVGTDEHTGLGIIGLLPAGIMNPDARYSTDT